MRAHHSASFLALLAGLHVPFVAAHDFWVQPNEYWVRPDAIVSMTLQVGHGPFRQRSPIPAQRITRFQAIAPQGLAIELHGTLRLGQAAEDADFRLKPPGAYLLVLQTDDHARTQLPSIRFNDYLRVEGLTPALVQRARLRRTDADGSERYSRCAKSIVLVGPPGSPSPNEISRPVGLPLEIVPEANPYGVPRPANMPVRVLYAGRALPGALVKLTDLKNDAAPFESHLTDQNGRATFTMPKAGTWLLNVIWTKPLPPSADTDFETVFSSLSFGFPAGHP